MEVVTTNPIRGTSCYTNIMNETWRIFCRPGTKYLSFTSVTVQVLFRAVNKSRYTKVYRKQVRGHDLSRFTKLSKYLNAKAKNVTNLLILLTVLCEVVIRFQ